MVQHLWDQNEVSFPYQLQSKLSHEPETAAPAVMVRYLGFPFHDVLTPRRDYQELQFQSKWLCGSQPLLQA